MSVKLSKILTKICIYVVLVLFAIIMAFPIVYTFLSSFKSNMEFMVSPDSVIPKEFTLENYKTLFNSMDFDLPLYLANSAYYTIIGVLFSLLNAVLGAYVFSRGEFPFKKGLFALYGSLIFITVGSISIYPTFDVLQFFSIPRTLNGLLIVKLFSVPVVFIFLIKGYIDSIPKEIDEAAEIDGCGFVKILFSIILPLLKPILATVTILSFNGLWNEYLMPAIFTLTKPEQRTLMVALIDMKNSSEGSTSWTLMLAVSAIAILPVLLTFVLCNKYYVKGLSEGAIKG